MVVKKPELEVFMSPRMSHILLSVCVLEAMSSP